LTAFLSVLSKMGPF